ncbi:MAG: hypothetical protein ACYCOU_07305 [Sulfobacillus sp.]
MRTLIDQQVIRIAEIRNGGPQAPSWLVSARLSPVTLHAVQVEYVKLLRLVARSLGVRATQLAPSLMGYFPNAGTGTESIPGVPFENRFSTCFEMSDLP